MRKNILITGPPRCGKSTLIERIIARVQKPLTGFFTREIREGGKRKGFSIITLDGKNGILAHENIRGRFRVGKYGVNLNDINQIAVPSMIPGRPNELVVIDEIGKMECLSPLFRQTLESVLDSENPVLGSIAQTGDRFIQKIRERKDVLLIQVTTANRDELVSNPQFYTL
ncbi:MAG: NTPase [Deltaproteobacteria bacterium]|nr:NTPase [Deltaproteobacteria bacterium]